MPIRSEKAMLSMRCVSKRFGATQALSDVSLEVWPGEVLALIGENGAGKSTLMKVLSGAHRADSGNMLLDGQDFNPTGPQAARSAGVAIVYQELNLAPDLTVEDNIMLGIEPRRWGWIDRSQVRCRVHEALAQLGHPDLAPDRIVAGLSIGAQQLIEIARALVAHARVVVLDEPTSSLSKRDVQRLFDVMGRLRERGIAMIYISHFLEEIRAIADRFMVLRDGRPAGTGQLGETSDAAIVKLMVGRNVDTLFPKVEHKLGAIVLEVDHLAGTSMPRDVSFGLRRGEIFGLFGLVGAGRTETLRQLFGLETPASGSVRIRSRNVPNHPLARIRAGLGFVSEDRKSEGLAQNLSIADNLTLSKLSPYRTGGLLNLSRRSEVSRQWMQRLSIKAIQPSQSISELSGGNQQKVAIARILHQEAEIWLLDEPTKGIDVSTKAEIYRLIGEMAAAGKAIIFVSSYLPELLAVCDSVGVMSKGRLLESRPINDWTEDEILAVAISA